VIEEWYLVYDYDLDFSEAFGDRGEAEAFAQGKASENGWPFGVMLKVPVGGTSMPELRAVTVYDEGGAEVFSTHAYDSELVPA